MKNAGKILLFVFLLLFHCIFPVKAEEIPATERIQSVIALVEKVKDFSKRLDFKETDNFKRLDIGEFGFRTVFFKPKKSVPFGFYDSGSAFYTKARHGSSLQDNYRAMGMTPQQAEYYDFYFNGTAKAFVCGSTPICDKMLSLNDRLIIHLVLHEDWHSNSGLPIYFDEATADLIAGVATLEFMGRQNETKEWLDNQVKGALALNRAWEELYELDRRHKDGELNFPTYLRMKKQVVRNYNEKTRLPLDCMPARTEQINETMICIFHSYTAYFPFVADIFKSTGYDLKKMIALLKASPAHKPDFDGNVEQYFRDSQEQERLAVSHLTWETAWLKGGQAKIQ